MTNDVVSAPPAQPVAAPGGPADAACHDSFRSAWEELEARLEHDLVEPLRAALRRHREAIESTGLEGDPPEAWSKRAEALLAYRRALAGGLLEPLRRAFAQHGPATLITGAITEALGASVASCRALPEDVTAAFPEGALAPRAWDGPLRRAGKFFARGFSAARRPGQERSLPLRATAWRHLRRVVVSEQDAAVREELVRWAEWGRALEDAWIAWGDEALPALVRSEEPDDEGYAERWEAIRDASATLQATLQALAGDAPSAGCRARAADRLGPVRARLEADLAIAGSSLLRPREVTETGPELEEAAKIGAGFRAWDQGVADRLHVFEALLSILAGTTAVQSRLLWRFAERCLELVDVFPAVALELTAMASELAGVRDSAAFREGLVALEQEVDGKLRPAFRAVPDAETVDGAVLAGSDSTVEALLAMVRQAPASLVLRVEDARLPLGFRKIETRTVPLQELARQAFDALRVERIRASTAGLVDAMDRLRDNVRSLPEVFAFAHEEARRELEEADEGAEDRARELVTEALKSMADSLRQAIRDIEGSVADARGRLASEISDGSLALLDRVAAGRMQARFLAFRSRAADLLAWGHERWGPRLRLLAERVRRAWTLLHGLATRGLRKGTEIVGGPSGEAAVSTQSVRALARYREVTSRLPLVYQRLFTLEPLSEAHLLAGRRTELQDAASRWTRWQSEDAVPLIVRGHQGSGVTSFLRVLSGHIGEDGGSVVHVPLPQRITDEATLAALLAQRLGLPACATLADLSTAAFAAAPGTTPEVVMIDDLEHLYLRVPDGTDLIERLLTLMAETEPRFFWVGGISVSAWQLVAAAEPTAISQVDVLDLAPLRSDGIREAIGVRHRRSGLPIRYEEPHVGHRLLRRRLRRMSDPEGYRRLLESDLFDRLERASSGHLRLALFLWLRSADFSAGGGLLMHAPDKPDFSILETLDLTQNFTLKAFLEHRTLTLAEHDRIFRLPRQESYQIFESLGNRHLIAAVARPEAAAERSEVVEDLRYELQPLLIGAVVAHLRTRNIVH